jgi:hypothetical protein
VTSIAAGGSGVSLSNAAFGSDGLNTSKPMTHSEDNIKVASKPIAVRRKLRWELLLASLSGRFVLSSIAGQSQDHIVV